MFPRHWKACAHAFGEGSRCVRPASKERPHAQSYSRVSEEGHAQKLCLCSVSESVQLPEFMCVPALH